MALSNAVANSILKPGVCTSATRPANPYEGQFIYETDTDYMLVYNGSAWVTPSGSVFAPTTNAQLANKLYVDGLYNTAYDRGSLGVTNAATAQTAANNAATTANAAMARSGGTFTGGVNMGSQPLFLRGGFNSENYLYWNSSANAAELAGWASVRIFVVSGNQTYTFKDNGNASAPGTWVDNSSIRFKDSIEPLSSERISDSIGRLRPVSYRYKKEHSTDDSERIGLIAEEVAEIFPEVVEYDDEGIPCGIAYSRLSVIAIAEIKSLRDRLLDLERKFDELSRHDD